ncbi:cysteine hydrolase family protein [Scleromatobacter humisilvae]|uniref:Isochorismatase family protein n=1 Tax=Scleromatobacter humisilvae TaxID=2897159 RepID=A0A9X1YGQ5_9BURK|nr:isochorismatase family protein [Scleromatobacter humisilvae]MCK9684112.1 isochorismatase family protein [Scleromatobacter humisilvae]
MAIVRPGSRRVLLVVDVQVAVMKDGWEAPRVIANVAQAVERARAQGVPVLWVQHESEDMRYDSPGWQWVPELVPAAGEVRLFKKYTSSFEETPLELELGRLDASHIVLAGAQSNWCIRATAYGALDRGYDLTLVADAHTTDAIERGDGSVIEARAIVDDLNIAMTYVEYPGRKARAVAVGELAFD